jgi:two-component system, OmpR family, response regulator
MGQGSDEPDIDVSVGVGDLTLFPAAYRATLRDEPLELTPTQVDVLAALVIHRDRVITRAELARSAGIDAGSVDVVLSGLRRVLGNGFIRNVRNRGWIIAPEGLGA